MAEKDEDAEKKRRRELLLALFALLMLTTEDLVKRNVANLVAGTYDRFAFGVQMETILAPAHANAAYLGRQLAGVTIPFNLADVTFGDRVANEQRPFLRQFVESITQGKLGESVSEESAVEESPEARRIESRAKNYVKRLLGTANEAWAQSMPVGTLFYWDDRGDAHECEDCKELALNSPYTHDTLPTVPGNCDTVCLFNCKCRLFTEDDEEGFVLVA